MHHKISTICIVTKASHEEAAALGKKLLGWFAARNVQGIICENGTEQWADTRKSIQCDLVLVLGGDGTLLSVARHLVGREVPLVGINMGKVGFLAEIPSDAWEERLQAVLDGNIQFRRRLALACTVTRGDEIVCSGVAANDFVLNRGALARVVRLDLSVNGSPMGEVRADGIIVATPSGSTGYAISAGGPLVHPDMDAYSVTPVCAFLRSLYPMVLPGEHIFSAAVRSADADLFLTQDGQEGVLLQTDDVVSISKAQGGLLYAEFDDNSYYNKLLTRGFIRENC
ncbi:NAD(+)/NADH kinase [Halodesulfovibrio spirochaetisodalis]|uniref:NAD kinase n=1 Tax=Halodesulfovibrio spirochaetisodalis TaxID=1560234 RepID=A0A1B7XEN6_9BACT|nr:NAD(+)/NADH kinase [Halodesulfovibrio spirochaetisodalis]OBQ52644.1 inorganic polyphosphate kinase [Halodesulfovibrio spirochaetisodalis]